MQSLSEILDFTERPQVTAWYKAISFREPGEKVTGAHSAVLSRTLPRANTIRIQQPLLGLASPYDKILQRSSLEQILLLQQCCPLDEVLITSRTNSFQVKKKSTIHTFSPPVGHTNPKVPLYKFIIFYWEWQKC